MEAMFGIASCSFGQAQDASEWKTALEVLRISSQDTLPGSKHEVLSTLDSQGHVVKARPASLCRVAPRRVAKDSLPHTAGPISPIRWTGLAWTQPGPPCLRPKRAERFAVAEPGHTAHTAPGCRCFAAWCHRGNLDAGCPISASKEV